jgi:hypothetical protein
MKKIKTNRIKKEIIFSLLVLISSIFPIFVKADGLVPTCGYDCGYADLLKLVNTIINWIITISIPISAGVFAWAGFQYMTSAVVDKRTDAKKMMIKVLKGFIFILSAWVIVTTVLNAIMNPSVVTEMKKNENVLPLEGVTGNSSSN